MLIRAILGVLAIALVPQAPVKETLTGATNVTRVDAVLMCGGATTPEAFPQLKGQGFTSIINLRQEDEPGANIKESRAAADRAGLKYIHVPVDRSTPDTATVDAFLQAVTDKSNHPMYVHCGSANRVAALWLVKRVAVDGWEIDRAAAEADQIGLTSPALRKFAIDYATAHRKR
jgi:uncharacterized protein (TIGR01244 family)